MHRRTLLLAAIFIGAAPTMATASEQLAAALEQAGYLSDLDGEARAAVRRAIVQDGFAGALDHPKRLAFADIEELAEGGVGDWLRGEIAPLLQARGIELPQVADHFPENATEPYSVSIGGQRRVIWQIDDPSAQAIATIAAFQIVNDLLIQSGAAERLHLLDNGGGNDGQAWLLTPEQAQIIRDLGGVQRRSWPFIPTNTPPDYGQYR
jgi:hypothetical protein